MTKPVLTWSFRILNCVSKGPHWSFTGLAAGWPLNKSCFSDYSSITRWRGLWRRLQKLGLQSISGWWHLTRTILSSCLEDSDTKQFHLLLKFHQQGMHKASGSLNKTPGNARVRQGEIPLVWEKPQLGHPSVTKGFFMTVSATYGCHRVHSFVIPSTWHKERGFDSVFSWPVSLTAEDKVPANKQSLPQLELLLSDFCIWSDAWRRFSGTWYPTDPMVCPTELMLLFARVVKVALVPLYIFRKSSQQSVTVWEGELHHSARTPLRAAYVALNNTKSRVANSCCCSCLGIQHHRAWSWTPKCSSVPP